MVDPLGIYLEPLQFCFKCMHFEVKQRLHDTYCHAFCIHINTRVSRFLLAFFYDKTSIDYLYLHSYAQVFTCLKHDVQDTTQ